MQRTVADLGGGSKVSTEPPFLAKSKIDRYTKATEVLDFMEPSSYKKTLAFAHLRVILNEY